MEIKAKDIEGFLIKKDTDEFISAIDNAEQQGYNFAIDEQGEKVLGIELCSCLWTCNGKIVPQENCLICKGNGFTVRSQ